MNDVIDMDEMLGRNDISSRFFKRLAEQRRVSRYKVGKLRRAGARTPAKQISAVLFFVLLNTSAGGVCADFEKALRGCFSIRSVDFICFVSFHRKAPRFINSLTDRLIACSLSRLALGPIFPRLSVLRAALLVHPPCLALYPFLM